MHIRNLETCGLIQALVFYFCSLPFQGSRLWNEVDLETLNILCTLLLCTVHTLPICARERKSEREERRGGWGLRVKVFRFALASSSLAIPSTLLTME